MMAIGLKITLGAAAVSSVFAIALNDRSQAPLPAPIVGSDFEERYPVMILPPSDAWRAQAVPTVAAPTVSTPVVEVAPAPVKVEKKHARQVERRRISCRRIWYTENRHRYWRCRR